MATRFQVAQAFASCKSASCYNARTDGHSYWLHGNLIAYRITPGILRTQWEGWITPTTQAHLNDILRAHHIPVKLSRAQADTQDWTL